MPLRDIIDMLGTMNTIKRQQEAQDLADRHEATQAYSEFTGLIANVKNPAEMAPLIDSYSQRTGIDRGSLQNIADHYVPSSATQQASTLQDYIKGSTDPNIKREVAYSAGTGRSAGAAAESGRQAEAFGPGSFSGEAARQFHDRTLSGLSSGGMAADSAMSHLPMSTLALGAQVKLGTAPGADQVSRANVDTAGQQLQGKIAGETLNQGDRRIGQEGAIDILKIDAGRGTGAHSIIEDARKRYQDNVDAITTKPHTSAGAQSRIDALQEDYDIVHGQGSFIHRYPHIRDSAMSPGVLQRILANTGF